MNSKNRTSRSLSGFFPEIRFREQAKQHLLCRGDFLHVKLADQSVVEVDLNTMKSLASLYGIFHSARVSVAIRSRMEWVPIDSQIYRPWFIDIFEEASGYSLEDRAAAIAVCRSFGVEAVRAEAN